MTTITHEKALELLRLLVKKYNSQSEAAQEIGITQQYLSDILNGNRQISDTVAQKLGYHRVVMFQKEE